jgi:hypothetical protein
MQSVGEDELRSSTGQEGIEIDINYKATVGRVYFSDNSGNFLNIRNISVDTDGSNHGASDRPINIKTRMIDGGKFPGLGMDITGINDLDISFEQLNVNGDVESGAVVSQANSYGGLSLTNISDNGGTSHVAIYADGVNGVEGIRLETNLSSLFSLNFSYTDYGSVQSATTDDYSLTADIMLNDFTSETLVDLISGTNADGIDIGGLRLDVVSLGGDVTLSSIKAGSHVGTMGRVVLDNLVVTPESYLTVQGK